MQTGERRSVCRFLRHEAVSVQVLLPCPDGSCSSKVVDSETLDISQSGLRIVLPEALAAHRIFDICVEFRNNPRRLLLTGETRWCRYNEDSRDFEIGMAIQDGEGTDFDAWLRMFAELEDSEEQAT